MSKITTQICKDFILKETGINKSLTLKRTKKYKDENGNTIREFMASNGQAYLVAENNSGELSMGKVETNQRIFTTEECEEAKSFLKMLTKKIRNQETEEDEDAIEDLIRNYDKKEILPSQFYFNFPKEVYGNLDRNVKNGLESSFRFKNDFPDRSDDMFGSSFCFKIMNKNEDLDDMYQLLFPLHSLFEEYFSSMDEHHYEFSYKAKDTNMTVKDVIQYLEKIGFEYRKDPRNSEVCLFSDYALSSKAEKAKKPFNAKKLLKECLKSAEDGKYNIMSYTSHKIKTMSKEDKMKIANEFYFYFPDGTYNNEKETITNGLDTLMYQPSNYDGSYCFTMHDTLKSEPDYYLSSLALAILPECFNLADEYNFELDSYNGDEKEIEKMTIRDVINILESLGFKYKNDKEAGDEQCMLYKLKLLK